MKKVLIVVKFNCKYILLTITCYMRVFTTALVETMHIRESFMNLSVIQVGTYKGQVITRHYLFTTYS